ncbi:MAG: MFS transporter, partial [Anaerolineae bacterium]
MTHRVEPDFPLPSGQRRNVLFVALDGAVIGLMSAAASFVSVWVVRLGASPFWVSLLSSMPSTIALIMTMPWSAFVARQRHPQRVFAFARLAVHTIYPLVAVVPFFLPQEWAARVIVLIWACSAFPSSLSNIMFTLVMGNAVPGEKRAFLMSRRWMVMGLANLVALPIVSQVIDRITFPHGYQLVYGINGLLAVLAFYLAMQLRVAETEPAAPAARAPAPQRLRNAIEEVRAHRDFLVFVGGRGVLNLGLTLISAAVPIYWVQHLQATDAWVGYFNSAASAATLIAYIPWVRIKRRYGTRSTLLPAVLAAALYPALLALTRTPAAVLPAIALNGFAGAGINLAFFDALLEAVPRGREARFVAINMTVVNLAGVIGPTLGAALVNGLPIRAVFVASTLVALGGVAIFAFLSPRRRPGEA